MARTNADEARALLAARREHSRGKKNFPTPEPHLGMREETPADRGPRDLPRDQDDRSAPKGDVTVGQDDRNPLLETRVPAGHAERRGTPSGYERARDAAAARVPAARPARPNARRSSSAKRKALRGGARRRTAAEPTRAAKDTEKSATRAAGERRSRARPAGRAGGARVSRRAPSESARRETTKRARASKDARTASNARRRARAAATRAARPAPKRASKVRAR
ncbi:MAG TPA: hypothetical protein VFM93_06310 [Candidatus Limnocylindria bacterium]|nr:hypothetical protein [Candidatus Limnocylindria bacterium]